MYPPAKERIDEIRDRLESKKIRYVVFKEFETFAKYCKAYSFEDEEFNNEHCGSAGCHYLKSGKIAKRPDAILVNFMVEGNVEPKNLVLNDREDFMRISNVRELIEKIDALMIYVKSAHIKD